MAGRSRGPGSPAFPGGVPGSPFTGSQPEIQRVCSCSPFHSPSQPWPGKPACLHLEMGWGLRVEAPRSLPLKANHSSGSGERGTRVGPGDSSCLGVAVLPWGVKPDGRHTAWPWRARCVEEIRPYAEIQTVRQPPGSKPPRIACRTVPGQNSGLLTKDL